MDVLQPLFANGSDYDYDEYYNSEALTTFTPCEKHLPRNISRFFLPIFYSVTCALGFLTNFILITVLIRCKQVREAMSVCLVCTDLMFTTTLPFWAVYAKHDWIFGWHACKIVTLVYNLALYGGNLFAACAVLKRHVDAACAFGCLGRVGARKVDLLWGACVCMVASLAAAPHLSFVEARDFHGETVCAYHYQHASGWMIYMRFQMIVLGFIAPFLLALGAAAAIRRAHRCHKVCGTSRLVTGLTALFFVLWFPYTVVNFLHALQELHVISECGTSIYLDLGIQITECLAFTRVFLNPVAYLYLNKTVRKVVTQCWRNPREYLLDSSDRADSDSVQDRPVELTAVQSFSNPEYERASSEKPKHFLPQPS